MPTEQDAGEDDVVEGAVLGGQPAVELPASLAWPVPESCPDPNSARQGNGQLESLVPVSGLGFK